MLNLDFKIVMMQDVTYNKLIKCYMHSVALTSNGRGGFFLINEVAT